MKYGEISTGSRAVRRRDKRIWYVMLGIFVMVAVFSFMVQKMREGNVVEAASLAEFDPGYIISDWQMGRYDAMSEAEIQAFLTKKNSCSNTNYSYYLSLSANQNYTWHWKDGHFVCLSEERFGDGEVIGEGDTAAHIIWKAAQDYRINPQVLIVLLQKETSLITDPIPNSGDYRKATGYGCPDTAPCSSQYYGFKNQVRKAAELFSVVLNGGWTNYPLGNNYIQYNPNSGCGGSVVNIRSLATSALYRYTPYQPNAGAIAAGYGTAYCGAYGNRNFYLYFQDWFGGITQTAKWFGMETPRYLKTKGKTFAYDILTHQYSETILESGEIKYYGEKIVLDNRMCLRTFADKENNVDRCVFYDELEDVTWEFEDMEKPRYLEISGKTEILEINTRKGVGKPEKYAYYTQKVFLPDGDMCLRMKDEKENRCVLFSALKEVVFQEYNMETPRYLTPKETKAEIIDPTSDEVVGIIKKNEKRNFERKIILLDGEICLLVNNGIKNGCVRYNDLAETWVEMERPREMQMAVDSYKINAVTLERDYGVSLSIGLRRKFLMKRYLYSDSWCLMTEYDYERGTNNCIVYRELKEI